MRKILRNTILSSLGATKKIGTGVHLLNSHYIGRGDCSEHIFSDLLKKIQNEADFINFEEAVQLISQEEKIDQKLVAFSFDDGFEECYSKIAPILDQFNTNAAFFINPGFIEGDDNYRSNFSQNVVHIDKAPMTWEMIKELYNNGFVIGNHSMDHVRLVGLTEKELSVQIKNSRLLIEEMIKGSCDYFAWTYGRLSDIDDLALKKVLGEHKFVFSGDNYKKYCSFNNSRVLNRRHIEGDWPISHVKYFLSHNMKY